MIAGTLCAEPEQRFQVKQSLHEVVIQCPLYAGHLLAAIAESLRFHPKHDAQCAVSDLERHMIGLPPNVIVHVMSYLTDREICNMLMSEHRYAVNIAKMEVKASREWFSVYITKDTLSASRKNKRRLPLPDLSGLMVQRCTIAIERGCRLSTTLLDYIRKVECSKLQLSIPFYYVSLCKLIHSVHPHKKVKIPQHI